MKNKFIYVFFAIMTLVLCFSFSAFAGFDLDHEAILELEKVENYNECYATGDVNGNNGIDAGDARIILRVSVNLDNIDASDFIKADIDGDGKITAKDAREALRLSVGLDKIPEHDIEEIVIVPATCETEGLTVKVCKTCVKIYAKVTVPAKENGHVTSGKWVTVKAPNCTEEGIGQLKCIFCSAVVKEEVLPKLNSHSGEWTYPNGKSCLDVHIAERICDVCGTKEAKEINPPGGCDYNWVTVKEKTCTEDGYRIEKCTYCEKERDLGNEDNIIKATGHLYERELVIKTATCEEAGIIADQCVNCQDIINTRETAPKGHSFDNVHYTVTKEPKCSEEGSADVFCIACSTSDTIVLPKTEHTLEGEWTVTLNPTCTEKGSAEGVCKYCGDVTKEIEATGHTVSKWVNTKPASCAEAGIKTGYCSVCGDDAATEEIAKLPHKYDTKNVYVASGVACQGAWEGYFVCKVCGGHSENIPQDQIKCTNKVYGETRVVTEATCTEKKTTVQVCDHCKGDIKGTERTSGKALGHSYPENWTEIQAATCDTEGRAERQCTRGCGHTETKTTAPTGHTLGEWVTVSEATCKNGEIKTRSCIVCRTVCEKSEGTPLPHTEKREVIADSAAVDENGNYIVKCKVTCSVCGTVISEEEAVTRIALENNGYSVIFEDYSDLTPGGDVYFTIEGDETPDVFITYGDGDGEIITPDSDGYYYFEVPTDIGEAETITIIVIK